MVRPHQEGDSPKRTANLVSVWGSGGGRGRHRLRLTSVGEEGSFAVSAMYFSDLEQRLAHVSCKGPNNRSFRYCGPAV